MKAKTPVTYRPKDFPIAELVPQATLASLGEDACWNLFDENALRALQAIRDLVGPCEVNTWVRGGAAPIPRLEAPGLPRGRR